MSYHICSHCGHHEAIFGQGGAVKMATDMGLSLLAQVPLHIAIREDIDAGAPTVISKPESEHAEMYIALAQKVASQLFWRGEPMAEHISIVNVNDQ